MLEGVENCFAGAAETLHQTDYADVCPIATVALEVASTNEALRGATAEVFESWITSATKRFVAGGIRHGTARALAITTITSLEGAFVLSRAMRSTEAAGAAVATQAALLSAA